MRIMERVNIPSMPGGQERAEVTYMAELWRRYHFPGKPPASGTEAANRLLDTCREYVNITNARSAATARTKEDYDPENYRTPETIRSATIREARSSDEAQRELHNQIAIMVFGTLRDDLKEAIAMQISNFAYELVVGGQSAESNESHPEPDSMAA